MIVLMIVLMIASSTNRGSGEMVWIRLHEATLTDLNWSRVFDRKVYRISFSSFVGEMREKVQATDARAIRIPNAIICQIRRLRDAAVPPV